MCLNIKPLSNILYQVIKGDDASWPMGYGPAILLLREHISILQPIGRILYFRRTLVNDQGIKIELFYLPDYLNDPF